MMMMTMMIMTLIVMMVLMNGCNIQSIGAPCCRTTQTQKRYQCHKGHKTNKYYYIYKAADFLFPRCLLTCQMIDRPTASHKPIAATEIGRFGSGESNLSIFRSLVFESN